MKKLILLLALASVTGAANASNVVLQPGASLLKQTRDIAAHEGYTLTWKLSIDEPAREAAQQYANWVDAVYGAANQLSQSTADTKAVDFAVPVVCDASKTLVVTTLRDALQMEKSDQGGECHALK